MNADAALLLMSAAYLGGLFGISDWLHKRGWKTWPKVFAILWPLSYVMLFMPFWMLYFPVAHPAVAWLTIIVVFASMLFLKPLMYFGPIEAARAVRDGVIEFIGKLAYNTIIVIPAVGLGALLLRLGVKASIAGIAAVCLHGIVILTLPQKWRAAFDFFIKRHLPGWRLHRKSVDAEEPATPVTYEPATDPVPAPLKYEPNFLTHKRKIIDGLKEDAEQYGSVRSTITMRNISIITAIFVVSLFGSYWFGKVKFSLPISEDGVYYPFVATFLIWRVLFKPIPIFLADGTPSDTPIAKARVALWSSMTPKNVAILVALFGLSFLIAYRFSQPAFKEPQLQSSVLYGVGSVAVVWFFFMRPKEKSASEVEAVDAADTPMSTPQTT